MYELTAEVAAIAPMRPEQRLLLDAVRGRPEEISRFLGAITGSVPIPSYFGPRNLLRLLGVRGMLTAARSRRRMAA
jgi:hypothetical protein